MQKKTTVLELIVILASLLSPMVIQAKAEDFTTIGIHVGDVFRYKIAASAQGSVGVWPYVTRKFDTLATMEVVDIVGTNITCKITANFGNGTFIHYIGWEYIPPDSPVSMLEHWGLGVVIMPANIPEGPLDVLFQGQYTITFNVQTKEKYGSTVDYMGLAADPWSVYWEWFQDTGVPVYSNIVLPTLNITVTLLGKCNNKW